MVSVPSPPDRCKRRRNNCGNGFLYGALNFSLFRFISERALALFIRALVYAVVDAVHLLADRKESAISASRIVGRAGPRRRRPMNHLTTKERCPGRCHVGESLMRVRRVSQLKSCGGGDFAPRQHG
jgi:hypothetical protein